MGPYAESRLRRRGRLAATPALPPSALWPFPLEIPFMLSVVGLRRSAPARFRLWPRTLALLGPAASLSWNNVLQQRPDPSTPEPPPPSSWPGTASCSPRGAANARRARERGVRRSKPVEDNG